jgi:putative Mg2+ transporter-C (MgtC) family protein
MALTQQTLHTNAELFQFFGPKLLYALLCGAIIGIEREIKHKAAGLKTNILICLGSTLFTSMSVIISEVHAGQGGATYSDPARLAAQVVSGIGFLGGGAIIQSRGTISGMTTAANIWVVAAIGVCVGLGYEMLGVVSSILVMSLLVGVTYIEERTLRKFHTFECQITMRDPTGSVRQVLNDTIETSDLFLEDFDMAQKDDLTILKISYRGHISDHKKFVLHLWNTPGVIEVSQE